MVINMNSAKQEFFNMLQRQIEKAEKENRPTQGYFKRQIELLKESHDEFIMAAKNKGYSLQNPKLGEIEIQQYSLMKQIALKAGFPVEEYDKLIENVKIRVFGEENYKRFFKND